MRFKYGMLTPLLTLFGVAVGFPLCYALYLSVTDYRLTDRGAPNFVGGANFASALSNSAFWDAFATTAICALAGYVPAYFIAVTSFRHKAFLLLLLMLPFWISYIIRTLSWINILGVSGAINSAMMTIGIIDEPIQMLYNEVTVVMGLAHYLLPFMILNIYVSLEGIDGNLVDAARSLGATSWQAFREVTLPLSMPGLMAGSLLCFVLGAGTYITPMILGGPSNAMFANLIYEAIITQLDWPMGSVLSIVLLVLLGSVVLLYNRFLDLNQVYKSFG